MNTSEVRRINLRQIINLSIKNAIHKNDAAWAHAHGIAPSYLSQLLTGHAAFGEKTARSIEIKANLLKYSLDATPLDVNQVNNTVQPARIPTILDHVPTQWHAAAQLLPVVSWVQAGMWTNFEELNLENVTEWLPAPPNASKKSFYLKVIGVSNEPYYRNGEYICVDANYQPDQLMSGDPVVVRQSDGATFKEVAIEPNGQIMLIAMNPDFKPQIIPMDETAQLVGLVLGSFHPAPRGRRR